MFFLWSHWIFLDKVVWCRGGYRILCFFCVFFKSPHFLHKSVVSCRGGYLHRTYVRFCLHKISRKKPQTWKQNRTSVRLFAYRTFVRFYPFLVVPPRAALYAIFLWIRGIRGIRTIFLKPDPKIHTEFSKRFNLTKTQFCGIIKVTVYFFKKFLKKDPPRWHETWRATCLFYNARLYVVSHKYRRSGQVSQCLVGCCLYYLAHRFCTTVTS